MVYEEVTRWEDSVFATWFRFREYLDGCSFLVKPAGHMDVTRNTDGSNLAPVVKQGRTLGMHAIVKGPDIP